MKADCEEPVEWLRSRVATLRLSRKTQRSVANLAEGRERAALAPARAAEASALKTSAFCPSENALRSICRLNWKVTDPPPAVLSVASFLDPSEKTYRSLPGTVRRNSLKSFAASSFERPIGPEIRCVIDLRSSRAAHGGS